MKHLKNAALLSIIASGVLLAGNAPKAYPDGELGRMVKLGEDIMKHTNTHPLTKEMVGNHLNCQNCHLAGADGKPGTGDGIGTFIGTATAFPAFSKREGTIQTLQDRINNCFMRSMNGKRPIIDTEASLAMAAYVTWLSDGMPMHMDTKRPCSPKTSARWSKNQKKFAAIQKKATHANYVAGQKIFEAKCASCHGKNGAGMGTFPPLWGKDKDGKWLAYNSGAGMSKLHKAAAWIQSNMPFGQGGTLKDQEAADVALYIDAQPRADFDLKNALFPAEKMGYYNTTVHEEKHSVRSNFKDFGLDVDAIRGDKVIH